MDYDPNEKTWYFVFMEDPQRKGFWAKFVKYGFSHVWVFAQCGNHIIMVKPSKGNVDIQMIENEDASLLANVEHNKNFTVVKYSYRITKRYQPWMVGNIYPSCVSAVKNVTGIKKQFLFTPYSLYRFLIKNGGVLWSGDLVKKTRRSF